MKKIITTILAATLILSTTACGQNTEIEALKEENEQLRAQLEDSNKPTETPTENIITPESLSDTIWYELFASCRNIRLRRYCFSFNL